MYAALLAVLLSAPGEPSPAMTIVRVVGAADEGSAVSVQIERGARRAFEWFLDVQLAERTRVDVARAVRGCGENNRCVAAQLRRNGVDVGLYVIANVSVRPALITVDLIDSRRSGSVARALVEAGSQPLDERVEGSVRQVLRRAGYEAGGRLFIRPAPGRAQVSLQDDTGRPADPLGLLPAGRYMVEARLSGFQARLVDVEVTPEQTASVAVQLEAEAPIWTKWWLWTAAAVVVGGVVAATVVATSSSDVTVCHPVGGNGC